MINFLLGVVIGGTLGFGLCEMFAINKRGEE